MTNHPPTGYPGTLKLPNKFKTAYPLKKIVTQRIPSRSARRGDGPSLRHRRLLEGRADAERRVMCGEPSNGVRNCRIWPLQRADLVCSDQRFSVVS
jgi:hypothetical protein